MGASVVFDGSSKANAVPRVTLWKVKAEMGTSGWAPSRQARADGFDDLMPGVVTFLEESGGAMQLDMHIDPHVPSLLPDGVFGFRLAESMLQQHRSVWVLLGGRAPQGSSPVARSDVCHLKALAACWARAQRLLDDRGAEGRTARWRLRMR
jgi:hypothetical protein